MQTSIKSSRKMDARSDVLVMGRDVAVSFDK